MALFQRTGSLVKTLTGFLGEKIEKKVFCTKENYTLQEGILVSALERGRGE